jgi:hypothetical protein
MAWEWVAPASAAAGAAVGAVTTWLTARGGRSHAERIATDAATRSERAAREERSQRRLESVYVELLEMVNTTSFWAQEVQPIIDTDPPRESRVVLPSVEVQAAVRARLAAFGSAEVKATYDEYADIVRRIIQADGYLRQIRADEEERVRRDESVVTLKRKLTEELKPAEQAKRAELESRIATELGGVG